MIFVDFEMYDVRDGSCLSDLRKLYLSVCKSSQIVPKGISKGGADGQCE